MLKRNDSCLILQSANDSINSDGTVRRQRRESELSNASSSRGKKSSAPLGTQVQKVTQASGTRGSGPDNRPPAEASDGNPQASSDKISKATGGKQQTTGKSD
jgi:hypothetical protein